MAPHQGIVNFNNLQTNTQESWYPGSHEFFGEPMFGGYISVDFVQWKRSDKYKLIVLQANSISQIPVPHGNHGCFASGEETNWAYEEIERRTKLAYKMKTLESACRT